MGSDREGWRGGFLHLTGTSRVWYKETVARDSKRRQDMRVDVSGGGDVGLEVGIFCGGAGCRGVVWGTRGSLFLRRGAGQRSARTTLGGWICRDF